MKSYQLKFCILFVLLFGSFFQIKAQSDSFQNKEFPNVSIASDMMNVLYIGLDNPISVAVSGYDMKDVIVKITNGKIFQSGNNYRVQVERKAEAKISVFVKIENGIEKPVGSMAFRVEQLPNPLVYWNNFEYGDSVSVMDLDNMNPQFFATYKNMGTMCGVKFNIISFELIIESKEEKILKTIAFEGNKLDSSALNILKETQKGNTIILDKIRAIGPGGKRYLAPLVLYVK